MSVSPFPSRSEQRLEQLLAPDRPLCREDVVWVLEYVKQKVAEGDPALLNLPQPRLSENFHSFAEIALMLIHRRSAYDQEADRLKTLLREAMFSLLPGRPKT